MGTAPTITVGVLVTIGTVIVTILSNLTGFEMPHDIQGFFDQYGLTLGAIVASLLTSAITYFKVFSPRSAAEIKVGARGTSANALLVGFIATFLLGGTALAQDVGIEGSVPGDGFARAGKCVVTPEAIYVVPGTDDTQGRVHIKCGSSNNPRIIHVYQVEIVGGVRVRYQDTQFDFGGSKTPNKDVVTTINTSCGPGSGTYSLDVSVMKEGNPDGIDVEEWTESVVLPVDGCN